MLRFADDNPNELLSFNEGASYLRLSVPTLRAWGRARKLPLVRLGTRVFLRRKDLDNMIEAGVEPAAL